jgi:hypothetical protein
MLHYCSDDTCANLVSREDARCGRHKDFLLEKYEVSSNGSEWSDFMCDCQSMDHYFEWRGASEAYVLDVDMDLISIDRETICHACDKVIAFPFVMYQAGFLEHVECVNAQPYGAFVKDAAFVKDHLCDICLESIDIPMLYVPACGCLMHQACFSHALRRNFAGSNCIDECPSRHHVKCAHCFWCSY